MFCCCFAPSLWLTGKTSRGVNIWLCRVYRGYRVPLRLSLRLNWLLPLPAHKRVCVPPNTWILGGGHTLLWWSECGETIQTTIQGTLALCLWQSCTRRLRPRTPPPRIWAYIRVRYWSAKIDDIPLWPPVWNRRRVFSAPLTILAKLQCITSWKLSCHRYKTKQKETR